jgi:hypothetical protein
MPGVALSRASPALDLLLKLLQHGCQPFIEAGRILELREMARGRFPELFYVFPVTITRGELFEINHCGAYKC